MKLFSNIDQRGLQLTFMLAGGAVMVATGAAVMGPAAIILTVPGMGMGRVIHRALSQ